MKKIFVLDTNVLLHDPLAIYKFEENTILIPIVVVEEIDKFKRDQSEVGRNARTISRLLDKERAKGSLSKGVKLDGGGTLQVVLEAEEVPLKGNGSTTNDNWILGVALHHSKKKGSRCILVTKDVNLRVKADAVNVSAEDYSNDKVQVDELYTGSQEIPTSDATIDALEEKLSIPVPVEGLLPNQFARLVSESDPERICTGQVNKEGTMLNALNPVRDVWGIQPLNREQREALELLLDPDIKLVSLVGKAGSGKTLMAIAAGLHMVIDKGIYHRLMITRPVHPMGKDLGFLPGDVEEKLRPWMQPIFDNLEYILSCTGSNDSGKSQPTYQYLLDKGWMTVEPLTYMRGRSIPNQYMILDDAQNISPHEIKSVITRAGHGTKIVLTGDPDQIDTPFLDASTNGVSFLVNRLKGQAMYGHVTLRKGERSELAELASNLL